MTENKNDSPEQLDDAIEQILASDEALHQAANNSDSVLRSAARLTRLPLPQLSIESRAKMLRQVQQGMAQAKLPRKVYSRVAQFSFWMNASKIAAVFIAILLVAGLVSTPAMASSLPGDALYPVKRQLESVELGITVSSQGKVIVNLRQAMRRLGESDRLIDRGRFEAFLLDDALANINTAIAIAQQKDLYSKNTELARRTRTVFSAYAGNLTRARTNRFVSDADFTRLSQDGALTAARTDFLTFDSPAPDAQAVDDNAAGTPEITEPAADNPAASAGRGGDFGCDQPGNACNAPGHTDGKGNTNNNSNGQANSNSNSNGRGNGRGRP